jgi:hypothetical protein
LLLGQPVFSAAGAASVFCCWGSQCFLLLGAARGGKIQSKIEKKISVMNVPGFLEPLPCSAAIATESRYLPTAKAAGQVILGCNPSAVFPRAPG